MSDGELGQMKPYLDEIADRLWSNSASAWLEQDLAVTKRSQAFEPPQAGRSGSGRVRPARVRRFAAARNPNENCEPSPLHSKLLTLPWRDMFTTNYDTLLERAHASVTLKHYDVVTKKEDRLYANQPRIVKLHGSFPSPPFVATEEDDRRYPSGYAPFVNTVRQSPLENTLCLIGFSGGDPNFLQWTG